MVALQGPFAVNHTYYCSYSVYRDNHYTPPPGVHVLHVLAGNFTFCVQGLPLHAPTWGPCATFVHVLAGNFTFCVQGLPLHAPTWGHVLHVLAGNFTFCVQGLSLHAPTWGPAACVSLVSKQLP